jgi:hypothetical protein
MRQSFALANQEDSHGLMLFLQANPFPFTPSDSSLNGFEEFVVALEEETLKFGRPVVLAYGDSRYFRVYKPYRTLPHKSRAWVVRGIAATRVESVSSTSTPIGNRATHFRRRANHTE